MINLKDIHKLKNKFYLDSEKEGLALRANTIILTEEQYISLVKELGYFEEDLDTLHIDSIEGLQVVFAEGIDEPKLLKL